MIYNQPLATRFGDELISDLSSGVWDELIVAVAWVRKSGMSHLDVAFSKFFEAGGRFTVIVGIDLNNTSSEGLEAILNLCEAGNVDAFVYHNEAGGVFHPKMYLFSNEENAKLIVGSNNLTQSGLYQNTEVGVYLDLPVTDEAINSARKIFATWTDLSTGVVKKLTNEFLEELVKEGYVQSEKDLTKKIIAQKSGSEKIKKNKLFKAIPVPSPVIIKKKKKDKGVQKPAKKLAEEQIENIAIGKVLLMRIRKAHAVKRPTQTQVPINLANSDFFVDIDSVTSSHDGEQHVISAATAKGKVNTMKLEIPEMRDFVDPVIRFTRDTNAIYYEVYDRDSAQGSSIMDALIEGKEKTPAQTILTKPRTPEVSTWWRFI